MESLDNILFTPLKIYNETNKCQKIKLQGLPVTDRVNYDFVNATTLTDLLAFF
jgi:hypothetical protein